MDNISSHEKRSTANSSGVSSPYLTCSEAANYLRKSPGAMRNLVLRKQISAYKVNRRLLFKKVELDRWLEKCRVGNLYGY
ncbi:MAG: helix-turn-helix domain-containing protein [Bdellovibrionales bacterium]|nr:helix-turn-helix domain-containing protein [Bdellovibrionales bacterium]